MKKSSPRDILSVRFQPLNRDQQLRAVRERLQAGKITKIFTPNPQILMSALHSKQLMRALHKADICLPDGVGIMLAARILGKPLPQRICGIDFAHDLLSLAAEEGYSVFLLGGRSGRAIKACRALKRELPSLDLCGCHNGYFNREGSDNQKITDKINRAKPDILFVCLGSPAQEEWIVKNLSSLPSVKLAMGLGGSLDIWSGCVTRAPLPFRSIGMEWLWRAMREPRRFKILAQIPMFFLCISAQKRASRKKAKRSVTVEN